MFNIGTINYSSVVPNGLLTGLVSYYDMENGVDIHGGKNMTINGSSTVPGKNGNAQSFDGINDNLFANSANINPLAGIGTGDFGVSFWFIVDSLGSAEAFISPGLDGSGNSGTMFIQKTTGDKLIYATQGTPDGVPVIVGTTTLTTATYANCIITRISGTVSMYLNNGFEGSISDGNDLNTADFNNAIGFGVALNASGVNGQNLGGDLDEIPFWNRGLDADDRAFIYNSGAGNFYPSFN